MGRWDFADARQPERRISDYRPITRDLMREQGRPREIDLHERERGYEPLARSKDRIKYRERGRDYQLNQAESALMREVGCFRAILAEDLARSVYKGEDVAFRSDLRHLSENGLVQITRMPGRDDIRCVSLTTRGRQLTERHLRRNREQEMYARAVKLRELEHDVRVYRMYEKEAERIRESGGRPVRVVLDFELKRELNRRLARLNREPKELQDRHKEEIAGQFGLRVVNKVVQIPDLRIEYYEPSMGMCSVDLELVTEHYKRSQVLAKAEAGFKLYGEGGEGGCRTMSEDLMVEIFEI